jgi:Flp pilus assembly protein TadD
VALDPEFAMAWRKLAASLTNFGIRVDRRDEAVERAYGLRERLTEVEGYLAEAYCHAHITEDRAAERRAYENALLLNPSEFVALGNLALIHMSDRRYDQADPELQPRVREARDRLAALSGTR